MIMPDDEYGNGPAMNEEDRELVHDLGLHIMDFARSHEVSVTRTIAAMEICKKLFIDLLYKT